MIKADKAHRIMQQIESDYDNFLSKLKAKQKAKKATASKAKKEADKADKTVKEAEAHKKVHLKEKAQNLLDKVGGVQGAADTVKNVMKYFKTDAAPSDYEMNIGGTGEPDPKTEKKIFGMPPVAVYAGGAVLLLAGLYGLSRLMKNKNTPTQTQTPAVNAPAEQVLHAAA